MKKKNVKKNLHQEIGDGTQHHGCPHLVIVCLNTNEL